MFLEYHSSNSQGTLFNADAVLFFRPVMEIPTDNPLSESDARNYFRDVHSGIEYCK
jgi:hypothetical protein